MRAYCRKCKVSWNVGIGCGLTTKSYRCKCGGELHVTPGPRWRIAGRLDTPRGARQNADEQRRRTMRELAPVDDRQSALFGEGS